MELTDDVKGYKKEIEHLERIYGIEPIEEHDKQIKKETLNELWKRAIYMHDEYIEYEELDNIIDDMLKEQS